MSCREGDARCGAAVAACTAARVEHPTIKEAGSKPGPRQHLCPEGVQGWRKEGEYRVAAWWAHTHTQACCELIFIPAHKQLCDLERVRPDCTHPPSLSSMLPLKAHPVSQLRKLGLCSRQWRYRNHKKWSALSTHIQTTPEATLK